MAETKCDITTIYQQLGHIQGTLNSFITTQARLEKNDDNQEKRIVEVESSYKAIKLAAFAVAGVVSTAVTALWNLFSITGK